MQAVVERGGDAEVAAPSLQPPEQLGVVFLARGYQAAVGGYEVDGSKVVAREPVLAHQPPEPAAERQAGDAGRAGHPERRRESVLLCRGVELAEREPGLGTRHARLRIHGHPFHRGEIDDHAAIAGRETGKAVPAPADGHRELVVEGEPEGPLHVGDARAPNDQLRRAISGGVPESDYVMSERPTDASSPFVFLVGGTGARRCEPLSYPAFARLFARAATRAGIREPWVTLHSLRHTHATRMWEGGMRELTLQRRLGHASVESTRIYTRVADHEVAADYQRALGQSSNVVGDA
jgi:hypothetical protein